MKSALASKIEHKREMGGDSLNRVVKKNLIEKVTFEQRLEGGDEQVRIYLEEKHPGQRD